MHLSLVVTTSDTIKYTFHAPASLFISSILLCLGTRSFCKTFMGAEHSVSPTAFRAIHLYTPLSHGLQFSMTSEYLSSPSSASTTTNRSSSVMRLSSRYQATSGSPVTLTTIWASSPSLTVQGCKDVVKRGALMDSFTKTDALHSHWPLLLLAISLYSPSSSGVTPEITKVQVSSFVVTVFRESISKGLLSLNQLSFVEGSSERRHDSFKVLPCLISWGFRGSINDGGWIGSGGGGNASVSSSSSLPNETRKIEVAVLKSEMHINYR